MLSATETMALKAAERRLVGRCGGQQACTLLPGMRLKRHQTFNDFGNPDLADRHMPADVIAALERDGGPEVTRTLAELAGCLLIQLPKVEAGDLLSREAGASAVQFGKMMTDFGAAIEDGTINGREAGTLKDDVDRLLVALYRFRQTIIAETGEGE